MQFKIKGAVESTTTTTSTIIIYNIYYVLINHCQVWFLSTLMVIHLVHIWSTGTTPLVHVWALTSFVGFQSGPCWLCCQAQALTMTTLGSFKLCGKSCVAEIARQN